MVQLNRFVRRPRAPLRRLWRAAFATGGTENFVSRRRKSNKNGQGKPTQSGPALPDGQGNKPSRQWYRMDLHLHSPASHDYEEPGVSYLDWLRAIADRNLDIVAITDHNTVAGIAAIRQEVEWLIRLERQNRLTPEERTRLEEWRTLSNRVLVLPGFEFTATFGFHVLGIFPPETSVRQLEHLLLSMNVPADKLDAGTTETGAATDVLTAYRMIHDAGGIVIAAHANSTHGVALRDFPFGGQTKIAYTQDANLDALEVTDLDKQFRSTARFFSGTKVEYPRRMHCIQGSDAHRITANPKNPKRLGIGDRTTEMLLDEPSFEAIKTVLRSKQFDRTRPARPAGVPFDPVAAAREAGPSLTLSFHESVAQRSGRLTAVMNDICAFANTEGGTIFVGAGTRKTAAKGLEDPKAAEADVLAAAEERMTPPLALKIETVQSGAANVLRIQVPKGPERPYCLDGQKIYVRDEAETNLAVRDEIVALVLEAQREREARSGSRDGRREQGGRDGRRDRRDQPQQGQPPKREATPQPEPQSGGLPAGAPLPGESAVLPRDDAFYLPQVGVEIVQSEERSGVRVHSIRDLRNGNVIHNVTRKGARKLWSYAIEQREDKPVEPGKIQWRGNVGLVAAEKRAGKLRYDLALRENGSVRVFYGVTEDGMEGPWAAFVQDE